MKAKFLVLSAILISFIALFAACGKTKSSLGSIVITAAPSKVDYIESQTFEPEGLRAEAVYVDGNGAETERRDITASLVFPSGALAAYQDKITVSYTENGVTKTADIAVKVAKLYDELPASDVMYNVSVSGKTAYSRWYVERKTDTVEISAIVTDDEIIIRESAEDSDGIEFIITEAARFTGIKDGSLKVTASADGKIILAKSYNNVFSPAPGTVTASSSLFSLNGQDVAGYKLTVSVPVTLLNGNGTLAVALGLKNATGKVASPVVKYSDAFGSNKNVTYTYIKIAGDRLEKSDYSQLGMTFGNAGNLYAKPVWNVDSDDGTEDAFIEMTSVSNDNNIYMYGSSEKELFATVKLSAVSVHNNERWGKFGITVTAPNGNGFMFYVDALGNGANMTGTDVGYALRQSGSWGGYTTISGATVGVASAYQGGNYVELSVYRNESVFVLYLNGNEICTLFNPAGIGTENAYAGIASFNIKLKAKEYKLSDDEETLAQFRTAQENVEYLFVGDSYVDKSFWRDFDVSYLGVDAVNIGVAGTKIPYWVSDFFKSKYIPQNIIIHIGVNDINDAGQSAVAVAANLQNYFEKILDDFPGVDIYYISLTPNNFGSNYEGHWMDYQAVNAAVVQMASENEKIHYIDFAAFLGPEAGSPVKQYYLTDGLHLNSDGYALWDKAIKSALGIDRPDGASVLGDSADYGYSSGWKFDGETAENFGPAEQQLYFSGEKQLELYAEAEISVKGLTQADNYPKFGIALKSANKTLFYYVDSYVFSNNAGSYVIRNSGADWQWASSPQTVSLGSVSYDNNFKKLAIFKYDGKIYLFADGSVIMTINDLFGADEPVAVSIMLFSLDLQVRNALLITDTAGLETIANGL
jgi:hypothetical protein